MSQVFLPLISPGTLVRELSEPEARQLTEAWLDVFGKNRQGTHTKAYLWHVFSYASYPSLSGTEARQQYEQQVAAEFIVLSNDRKTAFVTDLRPQSSWLSDFYVFPANLAWTMAFTHEDGWLGPYFARHSNFTKLDAENRAEVEKRRQIEAARLKGWC